MSAATIVEICKAKGSLQQLHSTDLIRDLAEEFLDSVEFVNVSTDAYHPEVGRELMAFLVKITAYCNDGSIALEVICRLKEIADTFHAAWTKEEMELISGTAYSLVRKFSRNARIHKSTVSQSAIALLKDLSTYKKLQRSEFRSLPKELIFQLTGRDEPDIGPPGKVPEQRY